MAEEKRVKCVEGQTCPNCGGIHWGSLYCPYSGEKASGEQNQAALGDSEPGPPAKPFDARALVEANSPIVYSRRIFERCVRIAEKAYAAGAASGAQRVPDPPGVHEHDDVTGLCPECVEAGRKLAALAASPGQRPVCSIHEWHPIKYVAAQPAEKQASGYVEGMAQGTGGNKLAAEEAGTWDARAFVLGFYYEMGDWVGTSIPISEAIDERECADEIKLAERAYAAGRRGVAAAPANQLKQGFRCIWCGTEGVQHKIGACPPAAPGAGEREK